MPCYQKQIGLVTYPRRSLSSLSFKGEGIPARILNFVITVRVCDNPVTMLESLLTTHIPKTDLGGTHRTRAPEETLAWLKPKWQDMGITRLADITGLDRIGLPVYMSVRPNAKTLSVSQGKGITHSLAKIQQIGLNHVLVVDLSQPEIDVPVVFVVIPHMENKAQDPTMKRGKRARQAHLVRQLMKGWL